MDKELILNKSISVEIKGFPPPLLQACVKEMDNSMVLKYWVFSTLAERFLSL